MKHLMIAAAVAALLPACASLPDYTQEDARVAAEIAREHGDAVGAACFEVLARRRMVAPVGALSALAAARALRVGRPVECAQVILDAQRRALTLGLMP